MEKTSFTPAELRALRANLCWCELPVHTNANGISLNRVTPFPGIVLSVDAAERLAASDALMDCAMGALVGLAVADSIGHPLEFLPVAPESGQGRSSWNPGAFIDADGTGGYTQPFNKFDLEPGQWTDDASMSLCLADSLLKCGRLDGSDVRLFFWSWWHCGLNNAFRNDRTRPTRNSVGLGGNISRSLFSMQAGQQPTPVYHGGTHDAGNGSLMRLAPIALFHHSDPLRAAEDARRSSYTTHPGPIAAEACAFMAHLLVVAMRDYAAAAATPPPGGGGTAAHRFLCAVADEYEQMLAATRADAPGVAELRRMLRASEPDLGEERCWNWRGATLDLHGTMAARGSTYNGYPNDAGYFGSYCLDGLAMALHSCAMTATFDDAVAHCVNLLGDADSTGAICGQIAGAMYGYRAIHPLFRRNLQRWDDGHIALRAALLVATGDIGATADDPPAHHASAVSAADARRVAEMV